MPFAAYQVLFAADQLVFSRLPLAFYLKLFGHELGTGERFKVWLVMSLSFVLSVVGTVWAFIPKSLIGAEPVAK